MSSYYVGGESPVQQETVSRTFIGKVNQFLYRNKVDDSNSKDNNPKLQDTLAFSDVVKEVLQKSSIYVISKVGLSRSPCNQFFWFVVLSLALIGCVYQICLFLTVYLEYNVMVSLHMETKQQLEFPAVTICNLNRMKESYSECLNPDILSERCEGRSPSDFGGGGGGGAFETRLASSERKGLRSCSHQLTGKYDPKQDEMMNFLMNYTEMSSLRRQATSSQAEDFIQECFFNGQSCSSDQFDLSKNLQYGNCFTFKWDAATKKTAAGTEYFSGLTLILKLDTKEYLKHTVTIGARVVVHDPREEPNPEERGTVVSPGFDTTISLRQVRMVRLQSPYKDHCKMYNPQNTPDRSQIECIRTCIQEHSIETCGCVDPTFPFVIEAKHCDMTNMTEICCLDKALEDLSKEGQTCHCPIPCVSTNYRETISKARWPSNASYFASYNGTSLSAVKEDTLKLNILFSSHIQELFEQKPMFHTSEVFSHLGGELGLWLGLSLVTIFEIIETTFYLVRCYFLRIKGK